jgi:hypothetical protein
MKYGVSVDLGVRCWILVAESRGSIPADFFFAILLVDEVTLKGDVLPVSSFLILIAIPLLSLPPAITLCDV